MGAIDTQYTFTATDTITSTKMNNIIDQTTITTDAIIGTTLDIASGKLKIRSQGITSNEMGNNSIVTAAITDSNVTTAKIADANVTTAKIADANVTQAKLAPNVAGNGPLFRVWQSDPQTILSGISTKLDFQTEDYDTNSNFASSRFTPTVSGYYLIQATCAFPVAAPDATLTINKNNVAITAGIQLNANTTRVFVSDIVLLNGSSDYVEIFAYQNSGSPKVTASQTFDTFFSGCLIRSA